MNSSGTGPQGRKSSFQQQLADVGSRTLGLAFLFGTLGGGFLGILAVGVMWLFSSGGEAPQPAATATPAAPATPVAANVPAGDLAKPEKPATTAAPPAAQSSGPTDPSNPKDIAEKLRRIALAMHNHHDRFRSFPVQPKKEWLDDQGRPKVSWRVHLLQFLDQQPLYDLFHLDEPWDSPHNKPLAEKMPEIYRSVPDGGTMTRMHVLSGDTMLFRPGRVPKIADCGDGTSQTIMIVHAGVDRADLWTKPDNLTLAPDHPLAALGDLRSRGLQAAMVDGTVWTFPPDLTEEEFGNLATPDGGEVVDASSVARRRERGIPPPQPTKPRAAAGEVAKPAQPAAGSGADVADIQAKLMTLYIAFQIHHNTYDVFTPPQPDPKGGRGTGLSWRVHLLPFLQQGALYAQFHLDEPWDSPHNKPLIDQMPDVFRLGADQNGLTQFQVFSGPNLLFGSGLRPQLRSISDGPTNTILVVVTGPDRAVPWTKPDELPLDRTKPVSVLGTLPDGRIHCLMADGYAMSMPTDMTADGLAALITPGGSEGVYAESLSRERFVRQKIPPPPLAAAALAEFKNRQAAAAKLKRIGLAMMSFHDTFRRYPPSENKAHLDPQGRPLLSWRVHILQFLDAQPLYKQFKLDEPWDSPHNQTLLGKMPDVYREADDPTDSTTTRVVTFTGPNTPFPNSVGIRSTDMRDGTWCTILLLRAGKDKAVPWTKPDDVPFDETAPLGGCGVAAGEGLQAVIADISVRELYSWIPNDVFKALVTPAGGEQLDRATLQEFGFR